MSLRLDPWHGLRTPFTKELDFGKKTQTLPSVPGKDWKVTQWLKELRKPPKRVV